MRLSVQRPSRAASEFVHRKVFQTCREEVAPRAQYVSMHVPFSALTSNDHVRVLTLLEESVAVSQIRLEDSDKHASAIPPRPWAHLSSESCPLGPASLPRRSYGGASRFGGVSKTSSEPQLRTLLVTGVRLEDAQERIPTLSISGLSSTYARLNITIGPLCMLA